MQTKVGSQVALLVKNPPANARDTRDVGSIPELGRSSGEGKGCPLEYSGLENYQLYSPWGHKESDMTEQLSTHTVHCSEEAMWLASETFSSY